MPGIAQAAVEAYRPDPATVELAAYYSPARDIPPPDADQIYAHLRGRLPSYMVPAYLEQLAVLPMLPSGKTDRKSLPAPRGERRLAAHSEYVAPADGTERELAGVLATVLHLERVSADSHFFDDLGADSLLMARFNAAVRERGDLPAGLDEGHLPASDHRPPRRGAQPPAGQRPPLSQRPLPARPRPRRSRRQRPAQARERGAGRPAHPSTCCAACCSCWPSPGTSRWPSRG